MQDEPHELKYEFKRFFEGVFWLEINLEEFVHGVKKRQVFTVHFSVEGFPKHMYPFHRNLALFLEEPVRTFLMREISPYFSELTYDIRKMVISIDKIQKLSGEDGVYTGEMQIVILEP